MIDRETVTDALRFWEIGRIFFNAVLLLVTLLALPGRLAFTPEFFLLVLVLGGTMNACYFIIYPVDLLVQASEWRACWRRWRWLAWFGGTLFAATLTYLVLSIPFPLPRG